ncbi:MAG: hypothetical protein MN733_13810 [Nitrososphaera sp.]|nr:hypothetical protein [Nitrososphaera sp.]
MKKIHKVRNVNVMMDAEERARLMKMLDKPLTEYGIYNVVRVLSYLCEERAKQYPVVASPWTRAAIELYTALMKLFTI